MSVGDQLKALEDESNFLAAKLGALVLVHRREVGVVEQHLAARRRIESGEQAEQRRLAAARWSDDRDERALRDGEGDVAQHGEPVLAAAIFLGQLSGNEHENAGGGLGGRGARYRVD